jgi:sugar lactone lactonase YvrE
MRKLLVLAVFLISVSLSLSPVAARREVFTGVLRPFVSLPAGLSAEGLAIHEGHFYIGTFSFTAHDGAILVFDRDGTMTKRITVPGLPEVGQLAFSDGALFAVAGNLTAGRGAVIRVNIESGAITTIATGFKLPNGLAVDMHGNLFVTDLIAGTVSKITLGGAVSTFASGPLLAPILLPQIGLTLGPNDLAFDAKGTALYVSNLGQGTIVRIQVQEDGTAGTITNFSTVPTPDGVGFDIKGNLYVTSPFTNTTWLVTPNGSAGQLPLNTAHESLANPSNVAFSGRNLYVTSLALTLPGPARISIVTAEFPGLPLEDV